MKVSIITLATVLTLSSPFAMAQRRQFLHEPQAPRSVQR